MQQKTYSWQSIALAGIIGIFAGWVVWGSNLARPQEGTHMMPGGRMMHDELMGGDMASMMHDMNAMLEGKTGDAFDEAFLSEMIVHHEGAVEMAQKVLEVSKRPELTKLANDIIKAQNGEIEMMKQWQSLWFK